MSWNYRVLRHKEDPLSENGEWLSIHEVHYQDGKPTMCTAGPPGAGGETLEEIVKCLDLMKEALDKPILDYDDF
jgi:hypothetical protein